MILRGLLEWGGYDIVLQVVSDPGDHRDSPFSFLHNSGQTLSKGHQERYLRVNSARQYLTDKPEKSLLAGRCYILRQCLEASLCFMHLIHSFARDTSFNPNETVKRRASRQRVSEKH